MDTGQDVRLIVEEELRVELEPAQTLLLHTEELTAMDTALKPEAVTHILAPVSSSFWGGGGNPILPSDPDSGKINFHIGENRETVFR